MVPPSIAPNQAPGGVVVQVYRLCDGKLLSIRPLLDMESASDGALEDAPAIVALGLGEGDVVMVAYDGDSGERLA